MVTGKESSHYIKDSFGEYRSEQSFGIKQESYGEVYVTAEGKPLDRIIIPIVFSTLSKRRVKELKPYEITVIMHFNAIKERLEYVSYIYRKGIERVNALLTDKEMHEIEQRCKTLKYDFEVTSNSIYNTCTAVYCNIIVADYNSKGRDKSSRRIELR